MLVVLRRSPGGINVHMCGRDGEFLIHLKAFSWNLAWKKVGSLAQLKLWVGGGGEGVCNHSDGDNAARF